MHERARTRFELLALFQDVAKEVVEKELAPISESTVISELGIDSLAMLEIVGLMERRLEIQIPDESLTGIQSVFDLLGVVEKCQAPRS